MPRKPGKTNGKMEAAEEIRAEAVMEIPDLKALRAEVLDMVREMRRDMDETLAGMSDQWAKLLRDMRQDFKPGERGVTARRGYGAWAGQQDAGPRDEFPGEAGLGHGQAREPEGYEEACLAAQQKAHEAMSAVLECAAGGEGPEPVCAVEDAMRQSLDEGQKVVQSLSALAGGGFVEEEEDGRDSMEQADAALRGLHSGPQDGDS